MNDFDQLLLLFDEKTNWLNLSLEIMRARKYNDGWFHNNAWYPWSHYLWEGDWNSHRPMPKLSMSIWDPVDKTWLKLDGVESIEIK